MSRSLEEAASLSFALVVIFTASGCGPGENEGWSGTIVDSAGIAVVVNPPQGLWSPSAAWYVEEDLAIGVASGDPEVEFGNITGLDVDSKGSIYILDFLAGHVRVLDSLGTPRARLGRLGAGPGELGQGRNSVVAGRADTIFAPLADRINIYLASGETAGELPFRAGNAATLSWQALPDGGFVYRYFSGKRDGLLRYSRAGSKPDTIHLFEYPPVQMPQLGLTNLRVELDPFPARPVWCELQDGRIAAATTDRYRIEILRPDGTVDRIVTHSSGRLPIDAAARQRIEALWTDLQTARGITNSPVVLTIPDSFPAFATFGSGPDNTLWVQRLAAPDDMVPEGLAPAQIQNYERLGSLTWDVFDGEGRYLGPVRVPYPIRLLRTFGDHIVGVTRGQFDEDRVVRLRVHKGSSSD